MVHFFSALSLSKMVKCTYSSIIIFLVYEVSVSEIEIMYKIIKITQLIRFRVGIPGKYSKSYIHNDFISIFPLFQMIKISNSFVFHLKFMELRGSKNQRECNNENYFQRHPDVQNINNVSVYRMRILPNQSHSFVLMQLP